MALLDESNQQYLVSLARILARTPVSGESGASIIQDIGLFDAESLAEMEVAINAGCEETDWRDWAIISQ